MKTILTFINRSTKSDTLRLIILLLIAFIFRATIAFNNEGTGDTGTWRLGGRTGVERTQLGMGNGTVYDTDCPTICSNWPPLTFHYMTTMRYVYTSLNPFHLPEPGFYKFFPYTADVGIIFMIYVYAKKLKYNHPLLLATFYAFHPVSVLISGYHGQRDTIWVFFSLVAIYFLNEKKVMGAASAFATGAAIKIPSLFFSPYLFFTTRGWSNKILFASWAFIFFFLLSLPEIVIYSETVFKQVFLYGGWSGWWGLGAIVQKIALLTSLESLPTRFEPIHRLLMYISVIGMNIFAGYTVKSKLSGVLLVILAVSITSPPFASQYLIWPLSLILLLPERYTKDKIIYTVLASFMAYNFYGATFFFHWMIAITQYISNATIYISYPMDTGIPVWIFMIYLLVKLLKDKKIVNHSLLQKRKIIDEFYAPLAPFLHGKNKA